MKYESAILKRLIDTYGVVGNPRYISEIIKEFIVRGKERFPNLFTYQADWLAHIDEFGLSPTYTVSYTGQSFYAPNTLERPVKSAILKGCTGWTNEDGDIFETFFTPITELTFTNHYLNVDGTSTADVGHFCTDFLDITGFDGITMGRDSVCYGKMCFYDSNKNFVKWVSKEGTTGVIPTQEIPSNAKYVRYSATTNYGIFINDKHGRNMMMPLSLINVKMPVLTTTGKNLFDIKNIDKFYQSTNNVTNTYKIRLKPNTNYTMSSNVPVTNPASIYFNGTKTDVNGVYINAPKTAMSDNDGNLIFYIRVDDLTGIKLENFINNDYYIQLEEGSNATSYEPFKSNILSTPEDVTLRGIGEVKDELDCLTGEKVERIGEVVYDGSDDENWDVAYINVDGLIGIATNIPSDMKYLGANRIDGFINDRLKQAVSENMSIYSGYGGWRMFAIYMDSSTFDSAQKIKQWLSQNPITVQYELDTESIKTVDLTIHDKDHQKVERLTSFEGGTHFTTSSQDGSLLPTLSVDVVTDLEETLKICSLEGNTM